MKKPSIFLSHTWEDKIFVRRLAADLAASGADVWLDEAEIKLGESLIEKIRSGIDDMDYVAVVLSPKSISSNWVKHELDIAMNLVIKGKVVRVLPLMFKECELPGFLEGKLYADFTDPQNYFKALAMILASMGLQPKIVLDPLTGLYNWRIMQNQLKGEIQEYVDRSTPFGVLMIDIDNFKKFNDVYGHSSGDSILEKLGILMKSMSKERDILCRSGGDKFFVFRPNISLVETIEFGKTLNISVLGELSLPYENQETPLITVSIGVAHFPEHGENWKDIFQSAHDGLTRAKYSGRNRLEVGGKPLD